VERIELRSRDTKRQGPGIRQLTVQLKLRLEGLTQGMEERIVVEARGKRKSDTQHRLLVLEPEVEIRSLGRAPAAAVSTPFREEFREDKPAQPGTAHPEEGTHAIHRSVRWDQELRVDPDLTRSALATRENVTSATIGFHLKLLRLVPEIREFLLELKMPQDLRRFSLRRMMALADLEPAAQRRRFALLCQARLHS
jgi:hypothetical protein